jgi:hypothetical protein
VEKSCESKNNGKISSLCKLNFSVHLESKCYYYPELRCNKFQSDLGVAVCQGKPDSERCCWLPSSVSDGCHRIVLKEGILKYEV